MTGKNKISSKNLLLEIGCEEIPARFVGELISNIKKNTEDKLIANGLLFKSVATYGTPRRLVLFIEGLPNKQLDKNEEIKGPPQNIAFDADNKLTKAGEGFAAKFGVDSKALIVKNNYVYALISKKGLLTEKILTAFLPEIILSLYLPISMRWGNGDFKFIRPVHWILALFSGKVIKFNLMGIKSSNKTVGHRFVKREIIIKSADLKTYKSKLKEANVIIDQNERKELTKEQIKKTNKKALVYNKLLDEVNYLIEFPYVIQCSFSKDFLALPGDVLEAVMIKHQRVFPVIDNENKLTSNFIVVTNGCKSQSIRDGNQRVISARLSDAKFFFDEDRKTPLRMKVPDLLKVQFFEGLGNMAEKTERLKKLAVFIAEKLKIENNLIRDIEKTAELSKADLLTQMVFEFPELQGVMGREYALLSGENENVAKGILEHYFPRFAGEKLPETIFGSIVSIADKIDTITGCFGSEKIPSGTADPYGLRRAVYGLVRIFVAKNFEVSLRELFKFSFELYSSLFKEPNFDKVFKQISEFIKTRMEGSLSETVHGNYGIVEAALINIDNITFAHQIAIMLNLLKSEKWLPGIVATHDRVFRITASFSRNQVLEHDLEEEEEKKLYKLLLDVNWNVEEALNNKEYKKAFLELARLTEPLEMFFEKVLVMHQDERLKSNRLALLKSINNLFEKVADFRKIT